MNDLYPADRRLLRAIAACVLFYFTFTFQPVKAQAPADTLELGEVRVEATRIAEPERYQPVSVKVLDSLQLQLAGPQNLNALLSSQTGLFIKNYGAGAAATVSQRGLGATQTQILWKGMPLNHPMLGLVDFSLLPVDLFSRVEVSSGSGSSAYGGGSLGGAIYLDTAPSATGLGFSQTAGAYDQYVTNLQGGYREGNLRVGVFGQYRQAKNDFTYEDPFSGNRLRRRHNDLDGRQLLTSVGWDGAGTDAGVALWVSDVNHEVPGSVVSGAGRSDQHDRSLRLLTHAGTNRNGVNLHWKGYFSRLGLDYTDTLSSVRSRSTSYKWMTEAGADTWLSPTLRLKSSMGAGLTSVETNNYSSDKQRRMLHIQVNPEWQRGSLRIYPALRFDSYSDFGEALSPSLGMNWNVWTERLLLRGMAGYNFNPPTFNDLYWNPGGNSDLKAERSAKYELGLVATDALTGVGEQRLTAYFMSLDQGIQWLPGANGIWSAYNIKSMRGYGMEWEADKNWRWSGLGFTYHHSLAWTRSEITESRFSGDEATGLQLAYVPEWTYRASLFTRFQAVDIGLFYNWTGARYTTDDHQQQLDPYALIDATLRYRKRVDSWHFSLQAQIQNLFNSEYQVIQWYPMPGRHLMFTLKVFYQP